MVTLRRRRSVLICTMVAAVVFSVVLAACGGENTDDVSVGTGAPGGSSMPADPSDPSGPADPPVNSDDANYEWYGLSKDDASAKADAEDRRWRIGREDDESFALTEDFVIGRVTFYIDDAIVTYVDEETDSGFDREGAQDPDDVIYMGLTEDEAGALADEHDRPWRTTRNGDESFAITMDFSPDRLNFELDNNVVTVITRG